MVFGLGPVCDPHRGRLVVRGGRVVVERVVPVVGVDEGSADATADVEPLVARELLGAARKQPRDVAVEAACAGVRALRFNAILSSATATVSHRKRASALGVAH